jgi:hypothetical protein
MKIGRLVRYSSAEVEAWIETQRRGRAPQAVDERTKRIASQQWEPDR